MKYPSKPISKKQSVDSQFKHNIAALEAENLKLQKKIAQLEAKQITLINKIIILEQNSNQRCVHEKPPYECIQKAIEIRTQKINELESKLQKS